MKNKRITRILAITVISVMAFSLVAQTVLAVETYSISGRKFNDENNSGTDDGEPGLEGWTISIESDTYPYTTTLTDSSGHYSFTDLQPGTYNVCESEDDDWDQTYPNTCDGCHITEITDQNLENIDFGNYQGDVREDECDDPCPPAEIPGCTDTSALNYNPEATVDDGSCEYPSEFEPYTISGLKFNDLNNNGVNDSEPYLAGWTITITDGGSFSDTTTTDTNGLYSFSDLGAGTYTVCEELQTDWDQTYPVASACHAIVLEEQSQHSNSCLLVDKTGRNITELSGLIRSDFTEADAYIVSDPISLLSGTYDINYTSYDDHSSKGGQNQPNEQWHVILKNSSDQEVGVTGSTSDIGENEDWAEGVLETDFVVSEEVTSLTAYHSYYPDSNPNSVYPKCVAFDKKVSYDFGNHYVEPPVPPVPGCMDAGALNYNPEATVSDDSCEYEEIVDIPGCMDAGALNYNPDATIDDGSCEYEEVVEIPGCTDSSALNYNPEATVDDGSCNYSGGSTPQPKLSVDKSVNEAITDPGTVLTYTVIIENTGFGKAKSVVLWDELPDGFTYVNENPEGKWEVGELLTKEERTISFEVLVSEDVEGGLYTNIAKITSSNHMTVSDDVDVEVRGVKGEIIIITEPDPEPIIKVLPHTGVSSFVWFILGGLGILLIGILGFISIFAKKYRQLIQLSLFGILIVGSLIALVYPFIPVIKYNLLIPVVEADTDIIDVDIDGNVIAGTVGTEGDWLIIPSIGVKIPVVLGQDDSSLEEGAWLLPDGSTPDLGGNTALAAHRYKYRPPHEETFYLLNKVSPGDAIYVYWKGEKYEYTMAYSKVVKPEAIEVLDQTEESIITLITCEPLFSDKNRLIVVGELNK